MAAAAPGEAGGGHGVAGGAAGGAGRVGGADRRLVPRPGAGRLRQQLPPLSVALPADAAAGHAPGERPAAVAGPGRASPAAVGCGEGKAAAGPVPGVTPAGTAPARPHLARAVLLGREDKWGGLGPSGVRLAECHPAVCHPALCHPAVTALLHTALWARRSKAVVL